MLSSHILAQVEALADRVSIIRLGSVAESGTLAELRHLTRTSVDAMTVRPSGSVAELDGVHDVQVHDNGRVRFDVDTEHLDAVIGHLHELGIRGLNSQPPTLEQLFMRHYGDEFAATTSVDGDAR